MQAEIMQIALQVSVCLFNQANAVPEGTVSDYIEGHRGRKRLHANWRRPGRASPKPNMAASTPERQAGPMRQHRPSLLIPTLQPVRTIGMWQICLTVPSMPT
jgi:hypothetical protein